MVRYSPRADTALSNHPVDVLWDDGLTMILAGGEDTGGCLGLVRDVVPAGHRGPRLHLHPRFDEGFYVLDGELVFRLGDAVITVCRRAGAGASWCRPHVRQPHRPRRPSADVRNAFRLRAVLRRRRSTGDAARRRDDCRRRAHGRRARGIRLNPTGRWRAHLCRSPIRSRDSGLPNDDNADRHCDVRMALNLSLIHISEPTRPY